MAKPLDDQAQTRLAVASLFVALARTLGEHDQTFLPKLEKNLEHVYRQLEDLESEPIGALETLRWAHELIRPPVS